MHLNTYDLFLVKLRQFYCNLIRTVLFDTLITSSRLEFLNKFEDALNVIQILLIKNEAISWE